MEIRKPSNDNDMNIIDVLNNKNKFLTKDHIDIIKEANQIMKERSKNSGLSVSTKNNSINDFILQNREICLKNFLIDLLKNERTSIAGKQEKITRALNDSEKKLENDYKEFMMYMDNEKNITKKNEQVKNTINFQSFFEKVQKNKILSERKKKLTQENKQTQDEIARQVSIIINYKTYALFIHKVMNDKSYKFSNDSSAYDSNTSDYADSQTKDFEKVVEKIL